MSDSINPQHYKQGSIEFIDAMEIVLTPEEFRGFLKGNAIKYLWREKKKQGIEDLQKAKRYLDRLVNHDQLAEVAGPTADLPIIRKIEKPKQYRPFASSAESMPFWDRKLRYKLHPGVYLRINLLNMNAVEIANDRYTYAMAFETFEFDDGRPFGVEVQ